MADNMTETLGANLQDVGLTSPEPADKSPKAFLVYRSNDFYDAAIPQVAERMRGSGIDVNVISFPAGTPEEQIQADLQARESEFIGSSVFTDTTVGTNLKINRYKKALGIWKNPVMNEGRAVTSTQFVGDYLDQKTSGLAIRAILRREGLSTRESMQVERADPFSADIEPYGRATSAVLRIALEKESPGRIFVMPEALPNHAPFSTYYANMFREFLGGSHGAAFERLREQFGDLDTPRLSTATVNSFVDVASRLGLQVRLPEEFVRKWIEESGYPGENVVILKAGDPTYPAENDWVIVDRHFREHLSGKRFEIPLADLVKGFQRSKLIERDDAPLEELVSIIAEELVEITNSVDKELRAIKAAAPEVDAAKEAVPKQ